MKEQHHGPNEIEHFQQRQLDSCEKVSSARRLELSRANDELQHLKDESASLKLKHDAAYSRIKCLEKEFRDSRLKLGVCLEKSKNDDALITALQSQIKKVKVQLLLYQGVKTTKQDMVFDNLKRICSEQEECIQKQEVEILQLKENSDKVSQQKQEITQVKRESSYVNQRDEAIIKTLNDEIQTLRFNLDQLQTDHIKSESVNTVLSTLFLT